VLDDLPVLDAEEIEETLSARRPGDRVSCDLDPPSLDLAEALIEGMRGQQRTYLGSDPERRLLVAMFDALVALFDRAVGDGDASRLPAAYVAFRLAIEDDLGASHDVTAYATRLGYSSRTLSRACRQAIGQTEKAVLADRLMLEAQRFLVHTDLPVAAIGTELGFSEAANFGKFFSRRVGITPGRFRATYR
jgi:AraC-like DNA-binding protein